MCLSKILNIWHSIATCMWNLPILPCALMHSDSSPTTSDLTRSRSYVEGVSIFLGRWPQKHMYAVGRGQNFVGHHFYCETASNNTSKKTWYVKNPLWDGLCTWCPRGSSCCFFYARATYIVSRI